MSDRLLREILAVALVLGAVLLSVALISHSPLDPSPFFVSTEHTEPSNLVGWLGSFLSAALLNLVGVSAVLLPILAGVLGWRMLRERPLVEPQAVVAGWIIILLCLPALVRILHADFAFRGGSLPSGGLVGRALAELLLSFAGPAGRLVILGFLLLLGVLMVSGVSAGKWIDRWMRNLRKRWTIRRGEREQQQRRKQEDEARRQVLKKQVDRLEQEEEYRGSLTIKELKGRGRFRVVRKRVPSDERSLSSSSTPRPEPEPEEEPAYTRSKKRKRRTKPRSPTASQIQEEFDFVEDLDSYNLPQISFLDETAGSSSKDSSVLIERSQLITNKCQEFRVRGEVVNIRTGPVITTYEFRLDSGIKISAVQNLGNDLALALRTESVRIDRIPGRATVGIEVPNPQPEVIHLRQLFEVPAFAKASSLLTLSLGVDIHGNPYFSDLARMPHLLIGGFTGSGKSVGINAMIMSILYKADPEQVRFIMVDPKLVELGMYEDIPHLLTPIITDPKKAANALGWAVAEMEKRFKKLAALSVRNLDQYNQLVKDPVQLRRMRGLRLSEKDEELDLDLEPMPLIVIIIDELADLMMTSSRAVEESITRLAQKARAVGIHLICATQRPSVDILTGIIKANFTCRIAYKVRSKFDSRTILDTVGAEHLLGRGDMLFLPPGTSKLRRLHGPLVTEQEIAKVVRYIKRFGQPEYRRDILTHEPLGSQNKGRRTEVDEVEELTDPMFEQAARLVVKTRKASASYVQRRLHLGYTRAARLLDIMEQEGLVSPLNGSKGREVLVDPDYFEQVDETHALDPDDVD